MRYEVKPAQFDAGSQKIKSSVRRIIERRSHRGVKYGPAIVSIRGDVTEKSEMDVLAERYAYLLNTGVITEDDIKTRVMTVRTATLRLIDYSKVDRSKLLAML
jgi:hypothetical protein